MGSLSLLQGNLANPGIEPRSPTWQADSLPAEPQGKPKNTGVGTLSFLQLIFLTQESNWGLLYCRQIVYQLSYQGSPLHLRNISIWILLPSPPLQSLSGLPLGRLRGNLFLSLIVVFSIVYLAPAMVLCLGCLAFSLSVLGDL